MEQKKITILTIVLFGLLLTGMVLKKQELTKQSVEMIYEKCPTNEIEPLKDSIGCIQSITLNDKRIVFTDKLKKY